ncbi:hypothetical protein Tcan_05327 [Toxocara canis]|uniref:MAM domain-containing protein n=1 Tax=Toxocara canis TaxID=6265 RepID=A0A0B2VU48_TOXCA|nr:hypothetical protein Tcan_05327 [Toxocara canis]
MELLTLSDFYACATVRSFNDDGNAASGGKMSCNFELPSICRFYSSPEESIQWKRGHFNTNGTRFIETFAIMMDRPARYLPSGEFIFVGELTAHSGYGHAILRADIFCQSGNGRLTFDFWKNDPNIQMKVCTRTEDLRSCTQTILDDGNSAIEVDVINPNVSPFAIEIIVSSVTEPSLLILDNLSYVANLCTVPNIAQQQKAQNSSEMTNSMLGSVDPVESFFGDATSEERFDVLISQQRAQVSDEKGKNRLEVSDVRRSLPIRRLMACEILRCDFEKNLCNFYNFLDTNNTGRFGRWEVARERMGNIHTGIRRKTTIDRRRGYFGGYAYVGADSLEQRLKGRRIYVLESPTFTLNNDSVLTFDLYRRSAAISLQVCLNNITNCVYEAPNLESDVFWRRNEAVVLPKTTRKVFFVATQWKKFKWLAIDNIALNYGIPCREGFVKKPT